MKIKKLVIENYKVFDHLELDFTDKNGDILNTIVLAGLNGSGKTTILELLTDLLNGTTPQYLTRKTAIKLELLIPFKSNSLFFTDNHDTTFLSSTSYSDKFDILIFDGSKNVAEKLQDLHFVINSIMARKEFYINEVAVSQALYFKSHDKTPKNNEIYNVFQTSFAVHNQSIRTAILEIIDKKVYEDIDSPPRSVFAKQVNDLNKVFNSLEMNSKLVEVNKENLIFQSINGQKIGFDSLSSGEKMLYFIGFTLNQRNPQNTLIMIDQPEDNLHPTWQEQILKLYQNVGENNQVIVATHSPQIIGSAKPNEVFLLEIKDNNHIEATHPRYTRGHSIKYILKEMGADPNDLIVIETIDAYLELMRRGLAETKEGLAVKAAIDAFDLDPNSEEMRRLSLSIKRFKAVGV